LPEVEVPLVSAAVVLEVVLASLLAVDVLDDPCSSPVLLGL